MIRCLLGSLRPANYIALLAVPRYGSSGGLVGGDHDSYGSLPISTPIGTASFLRPVVGRLKRDRRPLPWLSVFIAAAFAMVLTGPATASMGGLPTLSLVFREPVTVDGPEIRLGDIAEVSVIAAGSGKPTAMDAAVVAEAESLVVGQAAAFGLTRMFDTETLMYRALLPFANRYVIECERRTLRIKTRADLLPADSVSALVDAFLASQPRRKGETWKWEMVRVPEQVQVPAGNHKLELSFAGAKRKGKVELNLAIRDGERVRRTLPLCVNLRVEERVLVVRKPINRDEPLTSDNVALETRETTMMNDMALAEPANLIGRLAKATLVPGRVVTPKLVSLPPLVRRGQEARMVLRNGGVSITVGAICRQDGIAGQVITAKSLVNHKLIRARVTEQGLLEPLPGG